MIGASPYQQKHSAAIREGVEKIEQRLEEADGKIQVLEERLQTVRDEAYSWVDSDMPRSKVQLAGTRLGTSRMADPIWLKSSRP